MTLETDTFDQDHPFFVATVVFTFHGMVRRDAVQHVLNLGGRCGDTVTRPRSSWS
jgi:DNA polymerase III subunit epsilon